MDEHRDLGDVETWRAVDAPVAICCCVLAAVAVAVGLWFAGAALAAAGVIFWRRPQTDRQP